MPDAAQPDLLVVSHSGFISINRNVYVHLASKGCSVELAVPQCIPSHPGRPPDERRPEDPPIHWVKPLGTNPRYWHFDGLAHVLEIRRPRAVLLEGDPASILAITLSRWARRNKVPLFCFTNENNVISLREGFRRRRFVSVVRTLRSLLLARTTRSAVAKVFVLCDAAVESMKVLGFEGRIVKMPLGFDSAIFRPDARSRARIREQLGLSAPVIAYIGRVVPGKGIEFLVDALGMLMDLEWCFLIDDFKSTKPGDYEDRIQKQIAANPPLSVRSQRFHADHFEVAAYMNAADIVVAPSCMLEQYGRVLSEAMACEKVVVASDAGAYPELVASCGLVVPQANATALASALRRVLVDRTLAQALGAMAGSRARDALGIDVQVSILYRHVNETLSHSPPRSSQSPRRLPYPHRNDEA